MMRCYLCGHVIPEDQPFYHDHDHHVCKPCFQVLEMVGQRCFICRFPGRHLRKVEGLGLECEFCRGHVIDDDTAPAPLIAPVLPYLAQFGVTPAELPPFQRTDVATLRAMQTQADLPPAAFIDDFLRYCYPVFHDRGTVYLLRRMTPPTFVVYAIVQLAAAHVAEAFAEPNLHGATPFHAFARGWCHWIGYEAASRLSYDLERRQLRKWPELGGQGDFERFRAMTQHNRMGKINAHFRANLRALARKHLAQPTATP